MKCDVRNADATIELVNGSVYEVSHVEDAMEGQRVFLHTKTSTGDEAMMSVASSGGFIELSQRAADAAIEAIDISVQALHEDMLDDDERAHLVATRTKDPCLSARERNGMSIESCKQELRIRGVPFSSKDQKPRLAQLVLAARKTQDGVIHCA